MSGVSKFKVRSWSPTPEQQSYLREIAPTREYLHNLPEEFRRLHAGQWIAAKNSQIVATARTLGELLGSLPDPDDPTVLLLRIERGVTIRWRHS